VTPTPNSALTCFGSGGSDSRVYFFGNDGHIHEIAYAGSTWTHTDLTQKVGGAKPQVGRALGCYGRGGVDPRVYYLGTDNHVWELAGPSWVANDLTMLAGASPALANTGLTCFGWGGTDGRVYYLGSDEPKIYELAWKNGWVGRAIV
jgi:hypothetical protein